MLLLGLLLLLQGAHALAQYRFETGESLRFIGDSASFRYTPKAAANCTDCFVNFRLGALSELDAVSVGVCHSYGSPHAAAETFVVIRCLHADR
jgi:hypothetical protein